MPLLPVSSLDDPRLWAYRGLKERDLVRVDPALFIAEGELIVRRLVAAGWEVESVLLSARKQEAMAGLFGPEVPIHVAPEAMMKQILGFRFHTGVIAVGRRPPSPTVEAVVSVLPADTAATWVVCPEINNAENIGSIIRISAAFGADAVLLGPRTIDPFFRQSVRVSMGAVFRLPIIRSDDLTADLLALRQKWGFELVATVLDESAEPLHRAARGRRVGLLLGTEDEGLEPPWIGLCDRRVTIPMKRGTDSLNVAVAAAVFLYQFTLPR